MGGQVNYINMIHLPPPNTSQSNTNGMSIEGINVIHLPPPNTTNPTPIDSIEKGIRGGQVNYINVIHLPPPNTSQSTTNGMSIEGINVIHPNLLIYSRDPDTYIERI